MNFKKQHIYPMFLFLFFISLNIITKFYFPFTSNLVNNGLTFSIKTTVLSAPPSSLSYYTIFHTSSWLDDECCNSGRNKKLDFRFFSWEYYHYHHHHYHHHHHRQQQQQQHYYHHLVFGHNQQCWELFLPLCSGITPGVYPAVLRVFLPLCSGINSGLHPAMLRVFLSLCSEITPGITLKPYAVSGMKLESSLCNPSALFPIKSLWSLKTWLILGK